MTCWLSALCRGAGAAAGGAGLRGGERRFRQLGLYAANAPLFLAVDNSSRATLSFLALGTLEFSLKDVSGEPTDEKGSAFFEEWQETPPFEIAGPPTLIVVGSASSRWHVGGAGQPWGLGDVND